MKSIKLGSLSIDAVALGSQGNAVLGIRGSGKTYTATLLAEGLHDAGIPFIAFDPIGVWRFLRVPGAGKGYPVVVAGGQNGDLPLTVASAPEIVRAAMASGISLVIDLFDIELSKADWKRIVTACVGVLLHENGQHGLRHVFIEEAAEFAPQKVGPDQAQVYAEIEKLARMGGNSRLGYTLINQRSEEVSKAVLELCDNLFLHRQKGRNSLTALAKWLDVGNADNGKEIVGSMATLPTGECWAWMGETSAPVLVKVPEKNSLHPDRTVMRGDVSLASKKAVDVGSFVESMRAGLATFVEEAKANDPAVLRKRIAELEKQIASLAPDPKVLADVERDGIAHGYKLGMDEAKQKVLAFVGTLVVDESSPVPAKTLPPPKPVNTATRAPARTATPAAPEVSSALSGPQMKILQSLAMWKTLGKEAPTKPMVAMIAGYSHSSGGFANLLSQLKTAGTIDYPASGRLRLLAGAAAIPRSEAQSLFWGKLSNPQKKIVEALHRGELSKAQLGESTGYSHTSGGFANLLSELRTLGVIDYPAKGHVALEAWVFDIL